MDSNKSQLDRLWIIEKGLENNMAIMTLDSKGIITSFNRMSERLFGYTQDDVISKKSPELFYDLTELQAVTQKISKELCSNREFGYEVLLEKARLKGREDSDWIGKRKDGTRFPLGFSTLAIKMDSGTLVGYLVLAKDLTQKRQQEKEIEMQRASLASSSKLASLGEMAGGVAHEINNPLAIILGKAAKLIQQTKMGQDPKKDTILIDLEKIIISSERIAKIVKGMRAFSRPASNDQFEQISIREIVEDSLSFCAARFKDHGVEIIMNKVPNIEVECRETQISQVILSLLNNAFDAVQPLKEKWIKIEAFNPTDDKIQIQITDSGSGIPDVIADKLMQPFFTTKEVGKGTGLGLSVARGIINDHGGTLTLDRDCMNTRFVITMPVKKIA